MTTPLPHDAHPPKSAPPDPSRRVVAVVGPTAVGKSEVAENIARALGGEIVSADSMQVYRGLDVGTAKTPAEQRRVPYHCIDMSEPDVPYSAALYQSAARTAIADCHDRGHLPVLVGGTGMYVRAALDDWSFPPGEQLDNPTRTEYEEFAATRGSAALHAMLGERDPSSAVLIHPNNVRRVVRALEMLDEGTTYAEQHAGFSDRRSVYDATFIGLTMDRETLYRRIDERVDRMIESGLEREVSDLMHRGLRSALTASQAIGYKEFVAVLEGTLPRDRAIEDIKRASRRYAKRQLTWFRADPRVMWVDVTESSPADAAAHIMDSVDWMRELRGA